MIQRIQSLYLTISFLLFVSMFFSPLAYIGTDMHVNYIIGFNGVLCELQDTMKVCMLPVSACMVIFPTISLISIFLYKKRTLQMRFCTFNIILIVLFYGVFAVYLWLIKSNTDSQSISLTMFASFPLIAGILTYLALRAIGKDEALIRSLNRLR